jgi:hypothetical protein
MVNQCEDWAMVVLGSRVTVIPVPVRFMIFRLSWQQFLRAPFTWAGPWLVRYVFRGSSCVQNFMGSV